LVRKAPTSSTTPGHISLLSLSTPFILRASEASREVEDLELSREIKKNLTSRQARRLNFNAFQILLFTDKHHVVLCAYFLFRVSTARLGPAPWRFLQCCATRFQGTVPLLWPPSLLHVQTIRASGCKLNIPKASQALRLKPRQRLQVRRRIPARKAQLR